MINNLCPHNIFMTQIITDYDTVKSKNFTLEKTNNFSEHYKTLNIKYNKENFYIQTPFVYLIGIHHQIMTLK